MIKPYYETELGKLYHGDCLEIMPLLEPVDLVLTDPPYEIGFMGKSWDSTGIANNVEVWKQALRVLKPGGHLMAFGGCRTYHRMACAIEDAGFEIRDMIEWVYGSGFPKSLNIGKAVDKLQGNEREDLGLSDSSRLNAKQHDNKVGGNPHGNSGEVRLTKGTSEWEGWGTALKPAHEPICLARKPLSEKTVAENVLKWGTGGINVDGSRVGVTDNDAEISIARAGYKDGVNHVSIAGKDENGKALGEVYGKYNARPHNKLGFVAQGRFPSNVILSYAENEYMLKSDITLDQKLLALKWLYENA